MARKYCTPNFAALGEAVESWKRCNKPKFELEVIHRIANSDMLLDKNNAVRFYLLPLDRYKDGTKVDWNNVNKSKLAFLQYTPRLYNKALWDLNAEALSAQIAEIEDFIRTEEDKIKELEESRKNEIKAKVEKIEDVSVLERKKLNLQAALKDAEKYRKGKKVMDSINSQISAIDEEIKSAKSRVDNPGKPGILSPIEEMTQSKRILQIQQVIKAEEAKMEELNSKLQASQFFSDQFASAEGGALKGLLDGMGQVMKEAKDTARTIKAAADAARGLTGGSSGAGN